MTQQIGAPPIEALPDPFHHFRNAEAPRNGSKGHTYPVHGLTEFFAVFFSRSLREIWHTLKSPLLLRLTYNVSIKDGRCKSSLFLVPYLQ